MPIYPMPNPKLQSPSHVEVDEFVVAEHEGRRWGTPRGYSVARIGAPSAAVRLESLVVDGESRSPLYDQYRLAGIVRALREGRPLPPVAVTRGPRGLLRLEDGFHRFLGCIVLGLRTLPVIDRSPGGSPGLPRYRCA